MPSALDGPCSRVFSATPGAIASCIWSDAGAISFSSHGQEYTHTRGRGVNASTRSTASRRETRLAYRLTAIISVASAGCA